MEPASQVAGLIAFSATIFRTCVQAFEFFNTAQHIGSTGDLFFSKLAFQQYRLLQWGIRAGLDEVSLPNERLNWTLVRSLLQQLESFMTSAEKLKSKYGLEVYEEELPQSRRLDASNAQRSGLGKLMVRLRPEIYTTKGKIIQANSGTFKRLRWAATGKEQADQIIHEIGDLISSLERLLDNDDQQLRKKIDDVLLREIISRATTTEEVHEIREIIEQKPSTDDQAIQAAASLKHIRLVIGADKRNDEMQAVHTKKTTESLPMITRFKPRKLEPYDPDVSLRYCGVELALYDKQAVLVEWKIVEGSIWSEFLDQVRCLAVLLASPDGNKSRSLYCRGYLPWQEQDRYGFIYDIPDISSQAMSGPWGIKSLHQLISEEKQVSLSRRLEIAKTLAETLLQLHTAGWLHKNLRSQNVVFIAPRGSTLREYLLCRPYLVGYDYARPDTPKAAKLSQLPNTDLSTDLYRHPKARGIARERFQKSFDLYAFGCILMELALWTSVIDIQTKYGEVDWSKALAESAKTNQTIILPHFGSGQVLDEIIKAIDHQAGETLSETVRLSLVAHERMSGQFDASLDIQHAIADKLHR